MSDILFKSMFLLKHEKPVLIYNVDDDGRRTYFLLETFIKTPRTPLYITVETLNNVLLHSPYFPCGP